MYYRTNEPMDRQRIQKWLEDADQAEFYPGGPSHSSPDKSDQSRILLQTSDPRKLRNERPVISCPRRPLAAAPAPSQKILPMDIKTLVLQAESAIDFAISACASLFPIEPPIEPPAKPSVHQPSTAMIFVQCEKSRHWRRQLAAGASEDISCLTASAYSSSSVNPSSHRCTSALPQL